MAGAEARRTLLPYSSRCIRRSVIECAPSPSSNWVRSRGRRSGICAPNIGETTGNSSAAVPWSASSSTNLPWPKPGREVRRPGGTPGGRRISSARCRPDLVIVNPPRTGMDARVSAELERLAPRRVVYISCDPATLARDLKRLSRFRLTLVRAFDLFPRRPTWKRWQCWSRHEIRGLVDGRDHRGGGRRRPGHGRRGARRRPAGT